MCFMTNQNFQLSDYDYDLPPDFIAQFPAEPRDACKLMCIDRSTGKIEHDIFRNIIGLLRSEDVLVVNDTRVFPARIFGQRTTGAKLEVLLLKHVGEHRWKRW